MMVYDNFKDAALASYHLGGARVSSEKLGKNEFWVSTYGTLNTSTPSSKDIENILRYTNAGPYFLVAEREAFLKEKASKDEIKAKAAKWISSSLDESESDKETQETAKGWF